MRRYGQARQHAVRQGFVSEQLDARQVRDLVPLAGDNIAGGYLHHFGGHANPQRTVQGLRLGHAGSRRAHCCSRPRCRASRAGGKVTAVRTDRGTIGCDTLVIAAGPQINHLAASLGVRVPMVAARAEMIVTEPLPLMPIGGVDGNGLYGRQTLRGNLAYGGGPHEWLDINDNTVPHRSSTPLMRNIAARVAALFPRAAHARVIRSWAGIVENTPDGRPVIERMTSPDNLVIATLSSIGFGLSPATGHAVRDLVIDGVMRLRRPEQLQPVAFRRLEPDWIDLQGWRPPISVVTSIFPPPAPPLGEG